jgi:predicted amidophosphoribosyltransferase
VRAAIARETGRLVRWIDAVAEAWLGYDLPPPARAAAESAWSADPCDAYCHRCGDSVGSGERTSAGCAICRSTRLPWDRLVRLGAYETPLREWILATKFDRWSEMGEHLGRELGRTLVRHVQLDRRRAVVVPMPMPFLRRAHRRIDHANVLAAALAEEVGVPLARILAAAGGPAQATLTAAERRRRGGRTMSMRPAWREQDDREIQLVLVDDVKTTGSSLRAAARLLQALGPRELIVAVVAVADDPTRRHRVERPAAARRSEAPQSSALPPPRRPGPGFSAHLHRPPGDAW